VCDVEVKSHAFLNFLLKLGISQLHSFSSIVLGVRAFGPHWTDGRAPEPFRTRWWWKGSHPANCNWTSPSYCGSNKNCNDDDSRLIHPSNSPTARIGPRPHLRVFSWGSVTAVFMVRGCWPHAQPPTWRTRSPYLWPPETGWPSYTPGHWLAWVPRGCHSPYPLLWAPEGQ
jgi:hypothetical protein